MFVMVSLSVSTPSKLFFVLCVFLHMEVFECMLACVAALRGGVGTERGGERGGGGSRLFECRSCCSIAKYIGINHVGQSVNSLCDSET